MVNKSSLIGAQHTLCVFDGDMPGGQWVNGFVLHDQSTENNET